MQDFDEAIDVLQDADDKDIRSGDDIERLIRKCWLARLYHMKGSPKSAVEIMEKAVLLVPKHAPGWYHEWFRSELITAYKANGQIEEDP